MPISAQIRGPNYIKVQDNTNRTLDLLRKQLRELISKDTTLKQKLTTLQTTQINLDGQFTEEEFNKTTRQFTTYLNNVEELMNISDRIFDTYGHYVKNAMMQIDQYTADLTEAVTLMQDNQQRIDTIKNQIINRSQDNQLEVDQFLASVENEFLSEVQDRLNFQEDSFRSQADDFLSNLVEQEETDREKLTKFRVRSLLKIMIVNLSTQILAENTALIVKKKLETLDQVRVFITQELMYIKHSLELFKTLAYRYNYVRS